MKKIITLFLTLIVLIFLSSCTDGVIFSGELNNGKPHGNGTLFHPGGAIYQGTFYEGRLTGWGTWEHPNGSTYVGEWSNGLYHGEGTLTVPENFTYEGNWKHGVKQGYGTQTWADSQRYEGSWHNGRMHGTGTMYYPDGSSYSGEWSDNRKEGLGTLYDADGVETSGLWEGNQLIYLPVELISISRTELTLILGQTGHQLTAIATPADATNAELSWSSENPQIARVEEGLVTPVSVGQTTIIAAAVKDQQEAKCIVRIINPPVAVTRINLIRRRLTMNLDQEPVMLQIVIEPDNATNKSVTWSSSNPQIATVDQSGLVTPQRTGETVITVKTIDGDFTDECTITVQ